MGSSCWRSGLPIAARHKAEVRSLPLTAKAPLTRESARGPREFQTGSRRHAVAQRGEEFVAIDAMLAAGVIDRVEGCDRTANASHPEGEKHADRVRRRAHDVIDQIVGSKRHGQLRSGTTIAEWAGVSLSKRK